MTRTNFFTGGLVVAVLAAASTAVGFDDISVQRRMFGTAKKLPRVTPGKKQPTFNFTYFVDAAVAVHTDGTFTIDPTEPVYPTVTGTLVPGKHGKGTLKATDHPSVGAFVKTLMELVVDTSVVFTTTKTSFTFTPKKDGQLTVAGTVTATGSVTSGPDSGRPFKTTFSFNGKIAPPM